MARFFSKRAAVLGKRPGEMVYIGKNPARETKISIISYDEDGITKTNKADINSISSELTGTNAWINVEGISDVESMDKLKKIFKLNHLIVADIMNTETRPKFQEFNSGLFITLKMLMYDKASKIIVAEQLSLVLIDKILITFQEAKGDVFGPVKERLKDSSARIRKSGPDYLAYSLIDSVVDNYIMILQNLADRIEDIEELLLEDPDDSVLKQITYLKKELLYLSKSIRPTRDALKQLITEKSSLIKDNLEYFTDLYYNITQAVEAIDTYKEITTEQQNTYDTYTNNKLNEIMKFLTVFSVIFLPLTLITGIYGTNFDNIPELHFKYGYLFLWGLLLLFAVVMILIFKRKKWL